MIYLVLGRRERGKTTLAYWITRRAKRRVILDARRLVRRTEESSETVRTDTEFHEAIVALMEGEDDSLTEIVYWPQDDDLDAAFERFASTIKRETSASPRTSIAILIDEASFYDLETPAFQWLAKCSFRESVHIVITAHRPQDIPTKVRSIADHWLVFQMTQEHDLKAIAQRSPQVAALAQKLSGRAYIHWDDSRAALSIQRDEKIWFVPLGPATTPGAIELVPHVERDDDFNLE